MTHATEAPGVDDRLAASVERAHAHAVRLRHELHRIPEVGLDLPLTQAVIRRELDALGVPCTVGRGLTSVVGVIRGGAPGPTVLLRADMDALPILEPDGCEFASERPGSMHACGHDLHMAGLLGAARVLAEHRERFAGTVLLMFQPGEEGFHGARLMLEEEVLAAAGAGAAAPTASFAMHCNPWYPSGTLNTRTGPILAANDRFGVVLHGTAGHGSAPHAANDPIPALGELIGALQARIARHTPPFDPVVLSILRVEAGVATGGAAIPDRAELSGTMRTFDAALRRETHRAIERIAHGIASAHGLTATCEIEPGYPATVNDGAVRERALPVWQEWLPGRLRTLEHPLMGSEDFSYVLQQVPGVLAFVGTTPSALLDAGTPPDNHSDLVRYDDAALDTFVRAHVAFVAAHLAMVPA
ncbi:amidohydrolase [Leucobacter zeae]|nr:amidohydrolase [Leucobacter zeae]